MAKQKQPEYRINLRPYRIFYFPLLLPVALLLALFNKVSPVPFRIYVLRVDRIGQMAGNQEEFMCELDHGLRPREFRVFVHRDRPSNAVLLEMQKRVLPIHNVFLPLFDVCHKFGGLGVSTMELAGITGRDPLHLTPRTGSHLSFTSEEVRRAHEEIRGLGLDPEKPLIPVMGRDSAYLSSIKEPTDTDSYRNVDINTYVPAMEYLADRFQVLRMGSVVKGKLETSHPNICDYSLSGKRSELLDVYIPANCHFFLSCGTGLDAITWCFQLPVIFANYIPVSYFPDIKPHCFMIFKKYWHVKEKRYLTLSELLKSDVSEMYTPREMTPLDLVVHDNTPEELIDIVREVEARLDGTWEETEEDRRLQERFRKVYAAHHPEGREVHARVGAAYLRDNPFWLK